MGNARSASVPYQLFMLALCVLVLVALAAEAATRLDEPTREILSMVDTGVCVLFFADFLGNLYRAPDRWRYLATWGWIDLLSSIPTVGALRWGRAARAFRIIRVLRGFRAARILGTFALERRGESALLAGCLTAILTLTFSSIAILRLERAPESNITTAQDALWWAFVTITTVGYGDYYPVTTEGRVLSGLVMVVGIGLFSTLTAFVATWFFHDDETRIEIKALREELAEIQQSLRDKS